MDCMGQTRRPELGPEARRRNLELLVRLGAAVRTSRRRRGRTQDEFGRLVSLSQSTISRIERGCGGSQSLDTWQRIVLGLDRPLLIDFGRDPGEEPADAGHLLIQELVLRLARGAGYAGTFELPTRPMQPWRSADVGLRNDRRRRLDLIECWNVIGDIGAARASERKVAEARGLAAIRSAERPGPPYAVGSCWVVRATRRNRLLVARYPEVFKARFPASSNAWVRALTEGTTAPGPPGLVWCDVAGTRLYPWRRPR